MVIDSGIWCYTLLHSVAGWYMVLHGVIQTGIVDPKLKFIHATVGYPGSIHDARVLRLSGLYDFAENEQILSGPMRNINGTEIGPLLAGDSAYPLTNWLMKPFPDRGRLTAEQRKFNLKFSALRCVVERAFGMLKSRWRIILKKIEQKTTTLKRTVIVACVLHNICIERGDLHDADDSDSDDGSDDDNGGRNAFETGNNIRDTLKDCNNNNTYIASISILLFSSALKNKIIEK